MTNGADFERCWPAMGKAFGEVRPAATMMVVGLADARMKIEIEVTALRRRAVARREKTTEVRPKKSAPPRAKQATSPARKKAKAARRGK